MVVLGFLCRQSSRNAMDGARNTGRMPENLLALSGQKHWPEGRPRTAPCTQTATRFLDSLDWKYIFTNKEGSHPAVWSETLELLAIQLLMQLAHNLWQLLAKGWLHREFAACRKLTDVCLARLLETALRACAPPVEPLPAFQLRFADG
jgi:hypothetical protein